MLQDQIRLQESYGYKLPYKDIIHFLRCCQKPILVAGLGANGFGQKDPFFYKKLSKDLVEFCQTLADLTDTIGVRGAFTQEVLHNIGIDNVCVIGCPTFFENGPQRIIQKKPWSSDLKFAFSSNVPNQWLKDYDARIYLQDIDEKQIAGGVIFKKPVFISAKRKQEIKYIKQNRYRLFSSLQDWKKDIKENDFSVGYRVHGSIIALNSLVPAVVLNSDWRAEEMCHALDIPYHPELIGHPLKEIYEAADFSKMNKTYPQKYANFVNFMKKQGIKLAQKEKTISSVQYGGGGIAQPCKAKCA